mmetsp:Transcript_19510/g.21697  ORF Transcript_19510/g.21697 Transcript_19510/m.21697 type:complete len:251 (+) Transcript_19510:133-885(+)
MACLYIEVVANTVRGIYVIIDPLYSRRIFVIPIHDFFLYGMISLSLTTTVLIAFYWHEMLRNVKVMKETSSNNSRRFFIPCVSLVTIFILLEISGGIIGATSQFGDLRLIFEIVIFLASITAASYLLVMGWLVLKRLNKVENSNKSKKLRLVRNITIQLMSSSLFTYLFSTTSILAAFNVIFYPIGNLIGTFIFWVPLICVSITQISAIRRKPSGTSSKQITEMPITTNNRSITTNNLSKSSRSIELVTT